MSRQFRTVAPKTIAECTPGDVVEVASGRLHGVFKVLFRAVHGGAFARAWSEEEGEHGPEVQLVGCALVSKVVKLNKSREVRR